MVIVRGHLWASASPTEYVHPITPDKFRLADTPYIPVTFLYHRSTPFLSLCVSWCSRRCKQLSMTLPSVRLLVSLRISLPVNFRINLSPLLPVTSARLMSMDFVTTPLYLMDLAFSEWPHTELLPRWLISPHACFIYHAVLQFYYSFILWGSFP